MEIQFVVQGRVEGEPLSAIGVLTFDGPALSADAESLDAAASGALSRALAGGRFTDARGQICELVACHGLHGSITAALFLQRFIKDTPWSHLDIAPVAWKKPSSVPTIPEGATGYGVRLLNRLVADVYEDA